MNAILSIAGVTGATTIAAQPTDEICHECGSPMVIRHGRSGEFLGCSTFPKCRGTRSMPTGVKCPKDGGDIAVGVEVADRRAADGRLAH